jgi:hypothetical protein
VRTMLCVLAAALAGCASNPKEKQLNCDVAFGACSASIEQQGSYEWWVVTDAEYAMVTMDSGKRLPIAGYRRMLGIGDFGIASCQVCVKKVAH